MLFLAHCCLWYLYRMKTETGTFQQTILIVDDSESAIQAIEALLLPLGHRILVARNGEEAVDMARIAEPDMMLLDVMMPGVNGFDVCRALRADPATQDLPIIMVTALQDRENRLKGLEVGADDFLSKPVDRVELRTRVRATLRVDRYRRQLEQRKHQNATWKGTIALMTDLLSMSAPAVFGRAQRLERLAEDLGKAVGFAPLWELQVAALLSQVGRITLPTEVNALADEPQKLGTKDRQLLQSVPTLGASLLGHLPGFEAISHAVAMQGRHFDGKGYPANGPSGRNIPLGARIIRLVTDMLVFEDRGLSRRSALAKCKTMRGHHDPELLEIAEELFGSSDGSEKLLPLAELEPGMITRSSIYDSEGLVMVAPGIEITTPLIRSLEGFHARVGLREPFEVYVPSTQEAT